jgi:hypothetical protein
LNKILSKIKNNSKLNKNHENKEVINPDSVNIVNSKFNYKKCVKHEAA